VRRDLASASNQPVRSQAAEEARPGLKRRLRGLNGFRAILYTNSRQMPYPHTVIVQ